MDKEAGNARAEQREEIKLRLEYLKFFVSALGAGSILFAALQWRASSQAADEATYQKILSGWTSHLEVFIKYPELRPFFFEGHQLGAEHRNLALAVADVRLDTIDAILTFAAQRWDADGTAPWTNTFVTAFRNSPVLCARIHEEQGSYGYALQPAQAGCIANRGSNTKPNSD